MSMTKKKQAELIREGCKLDRRIKKAQVKLATIKAEMTDWPEGSVGTEQGDIVTIKKVNQYTEPNPNKVYNWFKKNLTASHFFSCVKIQVEITKKLMGEPMFEKFRETKEGQSVRIGFKTVENIKMKATAASDDDFRMLKL